MEGLVELDMVGSRFTWMNGMGTFHTRTHLDQMFASVEFIEAWPRVRLTLVQGTTRDDIVLFLELLAAGKGNKPFKFFNTWLRDDNFNIEFRRAWSTPCIDTSI